MSAGAGVLYLRDVQVAINAPVFGVKLDKCDVGWAMIVIIAFVMMAHAVNLADERVKLNGELNLDEPTWRVGQAQRLFTSKNIDPWIPLDQWVLVWGFAWYLLIPYSISVAALWVLLWY